MKSSKRIKEKGRKPQFIVFAGCAASGKTFIARLVAKDKGAHLIDKDDATRRFTDFVLELKGISAQDRESKF